MNRLAKVALALLCLLALAVPAVAQLTTVTAATGSLKIGPTVVSSGTVSIVFTDPTTGDPVSFAVGGGGLSVGVNPQASAYVCTVANGAITGAVGGGSCQVPDDSLTAPANPAISHSITICQTPSSGSIIPTCGVLTGVQGITGSTWNLAAYQPSASASSSVPAGVYTGCGTPTFAANVGAIYFDTCQSPALLYVRSTSSAWTVATAASTAAISAGTGIGVSVASGVTTVTNTAPLSSSALQTILAAAPFGISGAEGCNDNGQQGWGGVVYAIPGTVGQVTCNGYLFTDGTGGIGSSDAQGNLRWALGGMGLPVGQMAAFNGRIGIGSGVNPSDAVAVSQLPASQSAATHQFLKSYSGGSAGTFASGQPAYTDLTGAPMVSVYTYGATGNGTTDNTTALQTALTASQTTQQCLYLPPGTYKTTAMLTFNSSRTLCLRGDSWQNTAIVYQGTGTVDSALKVQQTSGSYWQDVDIRGLGIAANAHASYAFHALQATGTMDTVAFQGGSASAFEGNFWNGQRDLRNLYVGPSFAPTGSSTCVNGITFDNGLSGTSGTYYPSGQFTLTMPIVTGCTGIGLNLPNVSEVTVVNGQISGNHQEMYLNCASPTSGCNAVGTTLINVLLEDGDSVASQVYGNKNHFIELMGATALNVYGSRNVFENSDFGGTLTVKSGAVNNEFRDNYIMLTPTDSGTGTHGEGNTDNTGALLAGNWNRVASTDTNSVLGVSAFGTAATHASTDFDASGAAAARAATGACASGQYETADGTSGPTCAQVAYSQVSGTPSTSTTVNGQTCTLGSTCTVTAPPSAAVAVTLGGLNTTTAPSDAQIPIAQSASAYAPKTVSGDCTLADTGAITCTKTSGTAFGTLATASAVAASGVTSTTAYGAAYGTSGGTGISFATPPTTSGHQFYFGVNPSGSATAPSFIDFLTSPPANIGSSGHNALYMWTNVINVGQLSDQYGNNAFGMGYNGGTGAEEFTPYGSTAAALGSSGRSFKYLYTNIIYNTAAQTTVSCSTSGTAVFSQPEQGSSDKKVLIHMAACLGTASYTFPTAFTNTPSVYASNNVAASVATTVSTTAVTVTGATTTGSLVLEDY